MSDKPLPIVAAVYPTNPPFDASAETTTYSRSEAHDRLLSLGYTGGVAERFLSEAAHTLETMEPTSSAAKVLRAYLRSPVPLADKPVPFTGTWVVAQPGPSTVYLNVPYVATLPDSARVNLPAGTTLRDGVDARPNTVEAIGLLRKARTLIGSATGINVDHAFRALSEIEAFLRREDAGETRAPAPDGGMPAWLAVVRAVDASRPAAPERTFPRVALSTVAPGNLIEIASGDFGLVLDGTPGHAQRSIAWIATGHVGTMPAGATVSLRATPAELDALTSADASRPGLTEEQARILKAANEWHDAASLGCPRDCSAEEKERRTGRAEQALLDALRASRGETGLAAADFEAGQWRKLAEELRAIAAWHEHAATAGDWHLHSQAASKCYVAADIATLLNGRLRKATADRSAERRLWMRCVLDRDGISEEQRAAFALLGVDVGAIDPEGS